MHLVLTLADGTKLFLFLSGNFSFYAHEEGTRLYDNARPDGYFVKETPEELMEIIKEVTRRPPEQPPMMMPPAAENPDA